ncbi:TonB-dependent receptor [Proteiniphilum sp. X52]|uniref:SusC/RagA family TonB-linked outer membrane protein n=1 Tax=Proteiniphilum sp. X52 TaxID=2382159 RepID=UPI000F09DACC|nr:TonB-dependent receptor [Proteiniphilum sp. X52]RNC65577.1 SusC/RagA family TonB-linked outer membrane protein [Proteiniphilum sp. X52]
MRTVKSLLWLFFLNANILASAVTAQSVNVKLNLGNTTVGNVIEQLNRQTGYEFSYNADILSERLENVSVEVENEHIETVLSRVFAATEISFKVINNRVFLKNNKSTGSEESQSANNARQPATRWVAGVITDTQGEPVIGATVIEKGNPANGTVTDIDGHFRLNVAPNAVLEISYVGYEPQEVAIAGRNSFDITLREDTQTLDELVVIGYGTLRKSDLTGAISSVNVEELGKRTTTNPAEALQGKVAGVNVQKFGGNAGSGVQVKIRGVKTFGDNNPLYIVDGFPGDINNVNPQDIESMEILKDGAAAAIYGSIAANGVVLITTKSGKRGETKIEFNSYLSFADVARKLELLNGPEYRQVHRAMYENWNRYAADNDKVTLPSYVTKESNVNTDWQDAMLRNGVAQNYMLAVRGGAENSNYSISYNRLDEKGIFLGNNYRHDNARARLNMKKNIFELDANIAFKYTDSKQPRYSLKEMYMLSPLVPIYDESQPSGYGLTDFDGIPNNRNVMADHNFRDSSNKKYHTTANVGVTVNFTDWLNFRSSYAYRGEHERRVSHEPVYVADIRSKREYPFHEEYSGYWEEQVFDNVLSFNKVFNIHSVNAMIGSSVTQERMTWNSVAVEGKSILYKVENGRLVTEEVASGFLDPYFSTIRAGAGGTYSGDGTLWDYRRASFFGRLNYNYANKYLVQLTLRRDGSSKFGADSRWGLFPSAALGWRISQEEFFPEDGFVSDLKLRASWGRLGNEISLGRYDFLALISTYNTKYQGYVKGNGENPWPGSIARSLENKSLKWETTDNKNIGVDFGLYNNKLTGALNYYHNETIDLLITKALPPSAGLSNPTLNVGKMRNNGVELELNWNDKINDFNYGIGFNMATINNQVIALADANQVLYGEGLKFGTEHFPTQTRVGMPIGAFYLYRTDGLFQNEQEVNAHVNKDGQMLQPNARPGDIRFLDVDGDGVIDENDKEYIGSGIPKIEANLTFTADYKGFDLSLLLSSAWAHKLYNGNKYFYEGMNSGSNFLRSTLDAWTPQNSSTDVPRAVYQDPNNNLRESDRFIENGDFVRLRQLQLGYTLPVTVSQKLHLDKLRFYLSGENLFTITSYSGIDPEFSRSSVLDSGVDRHIYPFTRSYTVGLQLTF